MPAVREIGQYEQDYYEGNAESPVVLFDQVGLVENSYSPLWWESRQRTEKAGIKRRPEHELTILVYELSFIAPEAMP